MKVIGIVQPGKIGDVIICLPIAKYYHDRGYKIVWPIIDTYLSTFINVVDYVDFIPITNTVDVSIVAKNLLQKQNCDRIIELAFGFYGYQHLEQEFYRQTLTFDEYKYSISGVPFEEKWNLKINRNKDAEERLFNNVIKQDEYIVQHFNASDSYRSIKLEQGIYDTHQIVDIDSKEDILNGVFDWIGVLERAKYLITINSVFANLVNQLNINEGNRIYLHRTNYPMLISPVLRGKWRRL
jgi:hypothetical protein